MIDPDQCDDEVYRLGTSLGFFDMTKDQANEYCRLESERTGDRYDWHFVAGRVHVKVLRLATLTDDGLPHPRRVRKDQFAEALGRAPKMTGDLDYFEAMSAQARGDSVFEVTSLGDDIESYTVTQKGRAS